ncbi:MAG: pilus assembly protein [Angustibacter sp.]
MSPRRPQGDDGSALVEFCLLVVLLLVPLVYLVVALGRLEAGAFAVHRAAREAGRAFVTGVDDDDGRSRGRAAAELAFADLGFGAADHAVAVVCGVPDCHTPDVRVEVRSVLDVRLPAVPRGLDRAIPLHLQLTARQVVTVDRFVER